MDARGGRVILVHWNREEAGALAEPLRQRGWTVQAAHSVEVLKGLREDPPLAVVISLRCLPSHGREVADAVHSSRWGRGIPLVFFDGEPAKVAVTRKRFPGARFIGYGELADLLASLQWCDSCCWVMMRDGSWSLARRADAGVLGEYVEEAQRSHWPRGACIMPRKCESHHERRGAGRDSPGNPGSSATRGGSGGLSAVGGGPAT